MACGGIENSRMLLWFRENNKTISEELPIGNYWMEHPFKKIGSGVGNFKAIRNDLKIILKVLKILEIGEISLFLYLQPKNLLRGKILNSSVFLTLHDRDNDNFKNNVKDLLCVAPSLSKKFLDLLDKNLLCGITLSSSWEQDPEFKNKIYLSSLKDEAEIPFIKLDYNLSDITIKTAEEMVNQIGKYFIDKDLGRLAVNQIIYNSSEFISEAGYHHIGGTIMGENKKFSCG